MADPSASIVQDGRHPAEVWDRSVLDQGVPYPADMAGLPTSTPNHGNARRKSRRSWFETTPHGTKFEIAVEKPGPEIKKPKTSLTGDVETLTLSHFTAAPRLGFGNMKPGQVKVSTLLLRNPHECAQSVKVEKVPEKKMFTVSCREFVVGPGETYALEITWSPTDDGPVREMILMQVDKSYRLQAYVFGTVVAPPPKKKTRKTGLMASKTIRPFSVIHTSSLTNIDRQYSPDKKTKPTKIQSSQSIGSTNQNQSKPKTVAQSNKNRKRNSGERRRSARLSDKYIVHEVQEVKSDENLNPNTLTEKEIQAEHKDTFQQPFCKPYTQKVSEKTKVDEKIPRKKMRRSNTYSNTSGLGLTVPIIHGETVQGLQDTSLLANIDACNISGIQPLEDSPCVPTKVNNVGNAPSFLEPVIKTVQSNQHNLQPSFIDDDKEITIAKSNVNKFDMNNKLEPSFIVDGNDVIVETVKDLEPSFLEPHTNTDIFAVPNNTVKQLQNNANNTFHDSLEAVNAEDNNHSVELPSFLAPEVSQSQNKTRRKSRRSLRKSAKFEEDAEDSPMHVKLIRGAKRRSARLVISPDSFIKDMSSAKKTMISNQLSDEVGLNSVATPHKPLNDSVGQSSLLDQLKNLKSFIHEKSFEIEKNASGSFSNEKADQVKEIERRETFVKQRTSPRFSMPGKDINIRRGTFVTESTKMKILETQKPSEASPRRTTFTVIKQGLKENIKSPMRSKSEGCPIILETDASEEVAAHNKSELMETESTKVVEKEVIEEVMVKTDVKQNSRSKRVLSGTVTKESNPSTLVKESDISSKRLYSVDSLENDSFEKQILSPRQHELEQKEEYNRRATLTVTKVHPSDALRERMTAERSGIAASLFPTSENGEIPAPEVDDGTTNDIEEFDGINAESEPTPKSSQNSTFEISTTKNLSAVSDVSFPTTPHQLPTSPNPDHSRRSTHVVVQPKILDHSKIEAKTLFSKQEPIIAENEIEPESPSMNTRRRTLSARRSVSSLNKQCKKTEVEKVVSLNENEMTDDNKTDGKASEQLFFVAFDDKTTTEPPILKKTVRKDPKQFMKKRSNPVTQSEDLRAKRPRSGSIPDVKKTQTVPQRKAAVPVQEKPSTRKMGTASKPETRGNRTVLKPKTNLVKGIAQSKLILMKKSKTALPKHPLPFAAKNMYYDERWMEKQERGFVNWLNFILTPAEEYRSTEVKVKVDAGKLTVDVAKGGGVKLAPTNEALSLRAYSVYRKLNRLRKSACRLFQSESVIRVIQKLESEVESGRLVVRKDKMIHADLGIKQRVLDMLLSYNPLWLRMGMETIYGEVVPLQSNDDVYGLSRFIVTRLLSSPDIANEYAHPTVPHLYREGFAEATAQHTLKKFLMLVYFLDVAKSQRLIEHNPCLFCKDADVKTTKDLLLQFSRDCLAGEGDITRHLGYLGYKVVYAQTALDEFDFSVSKLATDLRDGVRLTRVLEFLHNKPELSKTLRVPAISRLQKIHNVEVVFKTLQQQGLDTDNVTARDIVDGHRERTLKLLWTIILHYQVELLLNEAQLREEVDILQKNLKVKNQLHSLLNYEKGSSSRRESEGPDLHTQNARLNLLLQWCRSVCAFYNIKIENFTVSFFDGRALCHILHYYHPGLLPLSDIAKETTMTHMADMESQGRRDVTSSFNDSFNSSAVFGDVEDPAVFERLLNNEKHNFKLLFEKVKELGGVPLMLKWTDMSNTIPDEKVVVTYLLYLCARLLDIRHESRAARVIQLAWRNYRLRKVEAQYKIKQQAATVIQRVVREYLCRQQVKRHLVSAICIQRVWRGHRARVKVATLRRKREIERQMEAVVRIQSSVRAYVHRRQFLQMKMAISQLQGYCRGYLLRRKLTSAALTIQKCWRNHVIRREQKHQSAAKVIQTAFRSHLLRNRYLNTRENVLKLQAAIRGHLQRKQFCATRNAAILIQRRFRDYVVAKQQKAAYQSIRKSVIFMQSQRRMISQQKRYRNTLQSIVAIQSAVRMVLVKKRYKQMKQAVIVVQKRYRAKLLGESCRFAFLVSKGAAISIQAAYKGHLVRKQMKKENEAATIIQKNVRQFLKRHKYLKLKSASVVLQRGYRAKLLSQNCRQAFLEKKNSAVILQSVFRGYLVRKSLKHQHSAAKCIQTRFRMYIQRKKFTKIRSAAIVLQRCYRAKMVSANCRYSYLMTKGAVLTIQAAYKGHCVRKEIRKQTLAAVCIQSHNRRFLMRKKFLRLKNAAIVLQQRFRANQIMQNYRYAYLTKKGAVLTIQAYFRGQCVRTLLRKQNYMATYIQKMARGMIQRKKYLKLKNAVMVCQKRVRANLIGCQEKMAYQKLKCAAILLQSLYRGKQCRIGYNEDRQKVIKIQSMIRMKLARKQFQSQKQATIVLQRRFRALLAGKTCRRQFLITRQAAIKIQSVFKGHQVRKELNIKHYAATKIQASYRQFVQRKQFISLKTASLVCQKLYRAKVIGVRQRQNYLKKKKATIQIQSVFRGFSARRQYHELRNKVIKIQTCIRGYQQRCKYQNQKHSAVVIQRRFREIMVSKEQRSQFAKVKRSAILIQSVWRMYCQQKKFKTECASIIAAQSHIRRFLERKKFTKLKSTVITLQRLYRAKVEGQICRYQFMMMKGAAMTIQAAFKGHLVRKNLKLENDSATKIQSLIRGHLERQKYLALKKAAIVCQKHYRAKVEGQTCRLHFMIMKGAAMTIQAAYKGHLVRKNLKLKNESATKIQSRVRGHLERQKYLALKKTAIVCQKHYRSKVIALRVQGQYETIKHAVIVLQAAYRGKKCRNQFHTMKQSAVRIQSWFRMRVARNRYTKLKLATTRIQNWYRSVMMTREIRFNYMIKIGAAITIQARIRGYLIRRMFQQYISARKIQSLFRMFVAKKQYTDARNRIIKCQTIARGYLARKYVASMKAQINAARLIQSKWRATRQAHKEREDFLTLKKHVTYIQTLYKSKMKMQKCRQEFLVKVGAAMSIQAFYRGHLVRCQLQNETKAAVMIQTSVRMFLQQKRYLTLKKATILCQRVYISKQLGKLERGKYQQMRNAAIRIQSMYRMYTSRNKFNTLKKSAVTIQSFVRGMLERRRYVGLQIACVTIQRQWRAELCCRQDTKRYLHLKSAIVCIQSHYRGKMARIQYRQIKAAIKIQNMLRMMKARKDFLRIKRATLMVQKQIRGWTARQGYKRLTEERSRKREDHLNRVAMVMKTNMTAMVIQRCYRNHRVMQVAKEKLHSVILIQGWMRAKLERLHYLRDRQRVVCVQRHVRTWLARRDRAARVIQRAVKNWLGSLAEVHKHRAALKLQALWRGHLVRKASKSKKLTATRHRIKAATASATTENTLGNRTASALDYLLKFKQLSQVLEALMHLEVATRLSWVCCEKMVSVNAVTVLYRLVRSCNRSLPHMEIIKYTVNIMLNLAKYEKTRSSLYDEDDSITTLVDLMSIYREKGQIFTKTCTLLGILALDNACKTNVTQDQKLVEKLRSLQKLTSRKHKLEETQRVTRTKMNATMNMTLMTRSPVKKHKIKPDWSLHKDKMSDIENPLKAINFVLRNFGVSIK